MGVGGVRRNGFDLSDQVLVEEKLADVADVSTSIGTVLVLSAVEVGEDVDVSGTRSVVAGEEGQELSHTLLVSRLKTAQESVVEVGCVAAVTVTGCDDSRVNTGGVAVPDLDHRIWDRLAGCNVDDLGVENEVDTFLCLTDVLPDILSSNIVLTLGDFWGEDAGAVAREED